MYIKYMYMHIIDTDGGNSSDAVLREPWAMANGFMAPVADSDDELLLELLTSHRSAPKAAFGEIGFLKVFKNITGLHIYISFRSKV